MTKICTGLNAKGRTEFEAFIDTYARDDVSRDYDTWWSDLKFESLDGFHFELGRYYAKSKNPETLWLDKSCLEIEDEGTDK